LEGEGEFVRGRRTAVTSVKPKNGRKYGPTTKGESALKKDPGGEAGRAGLPGPKDPTASENKLSTDQVLQAVAPSCWSSSRWLKHKKREGPTNPYTRTGESKLTEAKWASTLKQPDEKKKKTSNA